jgi:hypothetical protein
VTPAEKKRREAYGYESSTPQCWNCVGYRKARMTHDRHTGAVIAQGAICAKGKFPVESHGCCDKWSDRNGERLKG